MATVSVPPQFSPGVPVQVRCRFDGRWASGFVVSALDSGARPRVRVKRVSDGSEIPEGFSADDVRLDHVRR
jgi:hypothetical protein